MRLRTVPFFISRSMVLLSRFNTYKNGSPVQLLQQTTPLINRDVLNFKPVLVDTLFHLYKNEFRLLAS